MISIITGSRARGRRGTDTQGGGGVGGGGVGQACVVTEKTNVRSVHTTLISSVLKVCRVSYIVF